MRIQKITSRDNNLVKTMRKASFSADVVLVEGPKLITEALAGGFHLTDVAVESGKTKHYKDLLERCHNSGARIAVLPAKLHSTLGDVVTGQGILALATPRYTALETLSFEEGIIVICDTIQDPGNIGAIIRSATAFGAQAVVLTPGCANPFAAKAVRGSAGACFRIALARSEQASLIATLDSMNIPLIALTAAGSTPIDQVEIKGRCAIITGNEGSGIHPELEQAADVKARIPISQKVESLNTAVAASIALFQILHKTGGSES
jgi:TrmH family RNA methyltransferase